MTRDETPRDPLGEALVRRGLDGDEQENWSGWERGYRAAMLEARAALASSTQDALDVEALMASTDGLAATVSTILRKYGGTMKGRGDHDIFDALVRYRAAILAARGQQ